MVLDESKLRCGHEVGFGQVVSCEIHCYSGGSNLVFSHCGGTKKEQEVLNLCGFPKIEHYHKKDLYPLPFTEEILDMVGGHEIYPFLDGFLGYHQIMIAPKNRFKYAFITD
jgi:hypothetical protein